MTVVINFNQMTFPDNTIPKGHLPRDPAAQACWYYYILCEKQRTFVGKGPESQIIVEDIHHPQDTPWHDKHYLQTGRSIALTFRVKLEDMFNYWPAVRHEAIRLGLPEPHPEYMNPPRFIV